MGDTNSDFNITSLRDKLNKLNNLAAKAAKTPTRILSTDEFMGVERSARDPRPNEEVCPKATEVSEGNLGSNSSDLPQKETLHDHGAAAKASTFVPKQATGSYAGVLKSDVNQKKANFRSLAAADEVPGVDVLLPMQSVLEVNGRLANSLYGYFLGERLAFPIVETYVKNTWAKFGLRKVMMNNAGFFFFQFDSKKGMEQVLERGPWMIRSNPIFLKEWSPNVCLAKQDLTSVPVWVKMYDVPLVAYTEDGLSMLATKLGKPILLDSYTSHMCLQSWGRHSFARALIEIDASRKLKHELVVGIPSINEEGFTKEVVAVEYEWQPPHCEHCKVFGHKTSSCSAKMPEVAQAEKQVQDEGFVTVSRKKGKGTVRQVEGIKLSKPKPQFVYKPKQSGTVGSQPNGSSSGVTGHTQDGSKKAVNGVSMKAGESVSTAQQPTSSKSGNKDGASSSTNKPIDTNNIFSVLGSGVDEFGFDTGDRDKGSHGTYFHSSPDDDDEDKVEEVYNECHT